MIKSPPSKLLNFKPWLTVPEAAKHLSGICGEEVTEADILRLALDGHLKMSVNFVNKAHARPGQVVGYEAVKWGELPAKWVDKLISNYNLPAEGKGKPIFYITSLQIDDDNYLNLEEKVVVIEGVWDLPMIGNERIDIEHRYQIMTGGPPVELIGLDGPLVEGSNGVVCQLQEMFHDIHRYVAARRAQFVKLRKLELSKSNNRRKEKLLILRREKLEKLKKIEDEWNSYGRYYPAPCLPEDSVLVVRTEALREFEQLIAENSVTQTNPKKSDFSETERHTMLKLIIGMAIDGYRYDPNSTRNTATGNNKGSIKAALEMLGLSADEKTISKYLKQAAELYPEARPRKT
ncbi:MAG: hypothetical protein PHO08_13030 [Methylococcales bacterium]|nr:hypothetical protein [Methylococcales bacterium]MDD5631924.1 hypothetical protein [Methylococcales bacterium]